MQVPLDTIQGNIVKPFGRPLAVYLMLRFQDAPAKVRPRLKSLLADTITSAANQHEITHEWKQKEPGECASAGVGMFGLSAAGYRVLERPQGFPDDPDLGSNRFAAGMKNGAANNGIYLWDPTVDLWETQYKDQEVHAFLLLADDDPQRLAQTVQRTEPKLLEIAAIVARESVHTIQPPDKDYTVESFGFREGVSQVVEPESVLTEEPGGGLGCFAAFLKMEQDVGKLVLDSQRVAALAQERGASISAAQVQELAMGRRQDGTPLAPMGPQGIDDFSFQDVPDHVCPIQAHIRAMNPRNGEPGFKILRRGMSYETDAAPPARGLLFLCFQRSLLDFMSLLIRGRARLDPVLARSSQWAPASSANGCAQSGVPGQAWKIGAAEVCYPMADLTTVRGGEYFYIPSLTFISALD